MLKRVIVPVVLCDAMEGRGSFVVLLLGAVAVALVAQVRAETVQLITTKTESCLNCGMSAGQLDMKVGASAHTS